MSAFLVGVFKLSSAHIVYFHCSGAHAVQGPSTVGLENDRPVPSYLAGLSQFKVDRRLDAKALSHTVCVNDCENLPGEITIFPVHDNGL